MVSNFIPIILLLLLSAVLYAVFISPQYGDAKARFNHITELEEALSHSDLLQERRDELLAQKNSIPQEQQNLVDKQVAEYSSESVVTFILSLNNLLLNSGFGGDEYIIGAEQKDLDGIVLIPITFNFETVEYAEILRFIGVLENWERGIRIVSIRINTSSEERDADSTRVNAVVLIEALFSEEGAVQ